MGAFTLNDSLGSFVPFSCWTTLNGYTIATMMTPSTPQRRSWSVCSSHAIFQSDVNLIWPLLADFKTLPSLVPDVASCVVNGKVGLTRDLTFKDGKTVHRC
jgi:hypothetical protein